jgi:hypothetical protein
MCFKIILIVKQESKEVKPPVFPDSSQIQTSPSIGIQPPCQYDGLIGKTKACIIRYERFQSMYNWHTARVCFSIDYFQGESVITELDFVSTALFCSQLERF